MKPQTVIEKRRTLMRQIRQMRNAPTKPAPAPRQDRETAQKERELDRALDRAIREDRP